MVRTERNKSQQANPLCLYMLRSDRIHRSGWVIQNVGFNEWLEDIYVVLNMELTESLDNLSFLKRMNRCWQDHCRQTVSLMLDRNVNVLLTETCKSHVH